MAVIGATTEPTVADQREAVGRLPSRRPRRGLARSLLTNRKAVVGAALLGVFTILAIIPGVIAPYNPSAEIFNPGLPPSSAHLLGTTAYGQDVFSQLVWG